MKKNKPKNRQHMEVMKEKAIVPTIVGELEGMSDIKQIERVGSTILHTNMQVMMLMEEILAKEFKFTEAQINRVRNLIKEGLVNMVTLTRDESHPLNLKDIQAVVDLTKANLTFEQARSAGILLADKKQQLKIERETKKYKN
jgi:hypothetical protein